MGQKKKRIEGYNDDGAINRSDVSASLGAGGITDSWVTSAGDSTGFVASIGGPSTAKARGLAASGTLSAAIAGYKAPPPPKKKK